MEKSDYIFLMVLVTVNVLAQGPLVWLVRSRHGEGAGTMTLDVTRGAYGLISTVWVSVTWGFLWPGAVVGLGMLLVMVGTWLYRHRVAMRLQMQAEQQVAPDPREPA
ncbi:hypothetical protein [Frankia gtarii]|uniref:hypothetical protein n=1 Tax=Frankia gtarii TaxID=2950102 RepID=UPI0021BDFB1E|nr:hypothetical protein [Frankia gtarii]